MIAEHRTRFFGVERGYRKSSRSMPGRDLNAGASCKKPLNTNSYEGVSRDRIAHEKTLNTERYEGFPAAVERIAVTALRGASGPAAEQRMTEFLKLLIEIGNEEIRKGAAQW